MSKISTLLSACLRAGFCLVLLLSAHDSHGQTVKTIDIDISEEQFKYIFDTDGCVMISSYESSFRYEEDSDAPSLPVKQINVLVAPDQEFESISITGDERVVMSEIRILPNPYIVATNDTKHFTGHRNTSYKQSIYPKSCVEYIGTGIMDGYKLLSFSVCPFKYDNLKKTLFFIDNLSIKLILKNAVQEKKITGLASGEIMEDIVRGLIVNGSEMDNLYSQHRLQSKSSAKSRTTANDTVDYLIITNDSLAPAFAPLVKWKKQKGVRTEVKTVESIFSEFADSSWRDQVKIKHCIENYKNQKHTRFVLLGGSMEVVPVQTCYSECMSVSHGLCTEMIPADVFYASFDNDYGWDRNGNGIIGEGTYGDDGVDLRPDINLTRVPVYTLQEVNSFVNKTIAYEKNPPVSAWKNRALFGGTKTYNMYYIDGREMSDSEYEGNLLYTQHFNNKWNGTRTRYYDTWSDVVNGVPDVSAEELQELLADGYCIIDMDCHGSPLDWDLKHGGYYETQARVLTSAQPSIITTGACNTNWFDSSYNPDIMCLSEAFLRNPNSGVVAYIGSSREAWGIGGSTPPNDLGSSAWLNSLFYDSLFSNSAKTKHFGEMITKVKSNINIQDSYNSIRWLIFSVNPMGDCEMPIYTSTPLLFDNVSISLSMNGDSMIVNSGEDDCKFCVMDLDADDGYYQIIEKNHTATFTSLPQHYSLCITKQDYVPYVREFNCIQDESGIYYIQNESFIENNMISGHSDVMIGTNVTNEKAHGPVSVEQMKTTISTTGSVTIMGDFEVKSGAEFEIRQE